MTARRLPHEVRLIEWLDAEGGSSWKPEADVATARPAHCISVGFVVAENKECVVLVQSLDPGNSTADNHLVIPARNIEAQVTLRKGRA